MQALAVFVAVVALWALLTAALWGTVKTVIKGEA